ncbi:MAG: SDR family oxidoreductase [Alphaproteobacteria bacterium]|nr:SDR family oxidoreductase [Alphaproteobacteria bacterium]
MDLGLGGKKIIVTGGASHIGRAIVLSFAREGAALAILDRDREQAERTAKAAREAGAPGVCVIEADLSEKESAAAACAEAMARLGGIDGLVTNVGWNRPDFFLGLEPAEWQRIIDLNLTSVIACAHAVLPEMVRAGQGAIVSIASTAAHGEPRQSVYAAAKAGVVALIRTIAAEYGRSGIRANCVAPGLTLPEDDAAALGRQSMWHDREKIMNAAQTEYVVKATPLRRLSRPQDIANAVVFLASDRAARQITGELITISGGFGTH